MSETELDQFFSQHHLYQRESNVTARIRTAAGTARGSGLSPATGRTPAPLRLPRCTTPPNPHNTPKNASSESTQSPWTPQPQPRGSRELWGNLATLRDGEHRPALAVSTKDILTKLDQRPVLHAGRAVSHCHPATSEPQPRHGTALLLPPRLYSHMGHNSHKTSGALHTSTDTHHCYPIHSQKCCTPNTHTIYVCTPYSHRGHWQRTGALQTAQKQPRNGVDGGAGEQILLVSPDYEAP